MITGESRSSSDEPFIALGVGPTIEKRRGSRPMKFSIRDVRLVTGIVALALPDASAGRSCSGLLLFSLRAGDDEGGHHGKHEEESRADAKAAIDVVMEGEPVPIAVERLRIHAYL